MRFSACSIFGNYVGGIFMDIVILYGGRSSEHEVSLVSAASVARHIGVEHNVHLIGITQENTFFLQNEKELERIRKDETALLTIHRDTEVFLCSGGGIDNAFRTMDASIKADVVFPVLHGSFGEDGILQGLLEMLSVPYVGSGVLGSAIGFDKEKAKIIWHANGLPIVPYMTLLNAEWRNTVEQQKLIARIEKDLEYPVFVKPSSAGSSVGATSAHSRNQLIEAIEAAFCWDEKVLVEELISAREIECSVTGNTKLTAYIPGEIISNHEFYDYDAKYTDPNGAQLNIPADLTNEQRKTIRELALKAYRALDLKGFSRVDFFIDKRNGNIYLNEVNTIPGFTSISMFPKMCVASGLSYEHLIMHLIELAIEHYTEKQHISHSHQRNA